ncbi:MAG TPA: Rap1a/Tai family immunity protein, partial [Gammaproteobacteria bacterium]|nr:Rap1a/Tai family immunity protein [Gammaproteobacteria bacterium]
MSKRRFFWPNKDKFNVLTYWHKILTTFSLFGLMFFLPLVSHANYTGTQILTFCKPVVEGDIKSFNSGICLGFLNAAIQAPGQNLIWLYKGTENIETQKALTAIHKETQTAYCIPKEATNLAIIKTFVDYLQRHPETSEESASLSLFKALKGTYPCLGQPIKSTTLEGEPTISQTPPVSETEKVVPPVSEPTPIIPEEVK